MQVDLCPAVLLEVTKGVPSGAGRHRMEVGGGRDVH